jgi:hypothetical protein
MRTNRPNRFLRILAMLIIVGAVAYTFYRHRLQEAEDRVRAQIRGVIRDMDLSLEWEVEVLRLAQDAHAQAFEDAMDFTETLGRKFDEDAYYQRVFDVVVSKARASGMDRLADSLERQRQHFGITVREH